MLLHLTELHFHGLQTRLLLHHGLLDAVLLLLLLALLVIHLLLQHLHLLFVLFLDGLGLCVVTRHSQSLALLLLHGSHLTLDLLDTLGPSVLQKLAKVTLDLVNVLFDST